MHHEAFSTAASPAVPPSLLQGRITLLYQGKGADRESPASYRPITLLNTDYKHAASMLARLGHVLNHVVDATQQQRLLSLSWRPLTLRLSGRRVGCLGRGIAERAAVLADPPSCLFLCTSCCGG